MSKKSASLGNLARAVAERTQPPADETEPTNLEEVVPPEPTEPVAEDVRTKWDEKHMVYMHPAVKEQLRELAHDERTNMSRILLCGLDREFQSRGLRSIAELTKEPDWQTKRFTNF